MNENTNFITSEEMREVAELLDALSKFEMKLRGDNVCTNFAELSIEVYDHNGDNLGVASRHGDNVWVFQAAEGINA